MSDKIYIRGGLAADRPTLGSRELGLDTDTKQVWIGTTSGNEQIYAPYNKRSGVYSATTGLQSLTAATFTKLSYANEIYDYLGEFASSRFTAQKSGVYLVSAGITHVSQVDGNLTIMVIYVNGFEYARIYRNIIGGAGDSIASGSSPVFLDAGQYVEIYAYTQNAVSVSNGYMAINRL